MARVFMPTLPGTRQHSSNSRSSATPYTTSAAYPFAVIFYALLHAGKQVWIAGNNRPANADRLTGEGCRLLGDWPGRQIAPETPAEMPLKLKALDLGKAQLIIYTSGSSGQPKAIAKTLLQLQREVEVLEQLWGTLLGQATVVATVSHQHIYGLLCRLLWPLAAGRCFYSRQFLSPEAMLNAVGQRQPAGLLVRLT